MFLIAAELDLLRRVERAEDKTTAAQYMCPKIRARKIKDSGLLDQCMQEDQPEGCIW